MCGEEGVDGDLSFCCWRGMPPGERLFSDGSFWPDFTNEMGEFFKPIGSEAMDIHVQGLPSISNHFISEMAG